MRQLWDIADFVRNLRRRLRFGELSRAPLRLLRFELCNDAIECDWMARPADEWDFDLARKVREARESQQALEDAIAVRNLLFDAFPKIDGAVLRGFRQPAREPPEMIVLGTVSREVPELDRVASLVMRAKLYGFCFSLDDGILRRLHLGDRSEELISFRTTQQGQGGIGNGSK
ncbi:MAG: hypothetical protein ACRD4Y_17835 [Candidatus Acidiferrales bacterium]